ncbi:MAG: hypothetical protein NVSMB62_05850 [Acidobacteriaceae bacterium]
MRYLGLRLSWIARAFKAGLVIVRETTWLGEKRPAKKEVAVRGG